VAISSRSGEASAPLFPAAVNVFRNPRVLRVLRPVITVLALAAGIWHSVHTASMLQQNQQYKVSDPALSAFFWGKFQSELAVTLVAFFTAAVAWAVFRPPKQP
jgi:hypothetical protein